MPSKVQEVGLDSTIKKKKKGRERLEQKTARIGSM